MGTIDYREKIPNNVDLAADRRLQRALESWQPAFLGWGKGAEPRPARRRLIGVQGATEPASVEQQRHLGNTAPSLYDLRNLFQINVEEGRHLRAMVYLLTAHSGPDGR